MKNLKKILSVGLLGLGWLWCNGAQAETYFLTMDCTDCAAAAGTDAYPVQAQLTLQNYTLGDALDYSHFVSFFYSGSNLVAPYSITLSGDDGNDATRDFYAATVYESELFVNLSLWGSITTTSGANEVVLSFDDGLHFLTRSDGSWSTCAPNPQGGYYGGNSCLFGEFPINVSDYGTGATYSLAAVPEPEQALLLGAGLLLMGAAVRRQRRS